MKETPTFKVLCYNLEKRNLVSKMLNKIEPDICLFQEWALAFNEESIFETSYHYRYTESLKKVENHVEQVFIH
jgi:hypothetical protein